MKIIVQPDADEFAKLLFPGGPDSETALELRQSIAAELARRYLKDVVNTPTFKQRAAQIDQAAVNELMATYAQGEGRGIRLNQAARELIGKEIEAAFAEQKAPIMAAVQQVLAKVDRDVTDNIASHKRAFYVRIDEVDLQKMVDKAVAKYLDAKLNPDGSRLRV